MARLTKYSWHWHIFRFFWHKTPNDEGCTYFWGWFLLLITAPVNLIGCLVYKWSIASYYYEDRYEKDYHGITFKILIYLINTLILVGVSGLFGVALSYLIAQVIVFPWYYLLLFGKIIGSILAFCAAILLIVAGFVYGDEEIKPFIQENIKGFKEKWCPKIEWVDKK